MIRLRGGDPTVRDGIDIAGVADKPVMEPLYLDLAEDPEEPASPIHLGFRMGIKALGDYLESRQAIGVNHVALNLRFNRVDPEQTLRLLAEAVLPVFNCGALI